MNKSKKLPWQEEAKPEAYMPPHHTPPPPPAPPVWDVTHTQIYDLVRGTDAILRASFDLIWRKLEEIEKTLKSLEKR